jgi:hypothetical protein
MQKNLGIKLKEKSRSEDLAPAKDGMEIFTEASRSRAQLLYNLLAASNYFPYRSYSFLEIGEKHEIKMNNVIKYISLCCTRTNVEL